VNFAPFHRSALERRTSFYAWRITVAPVKSRDRRRTFLDASGHALGCSDALLPGLCMRRTGVPLPTPGRNLANCCLSSTLSDPVGLAGRAGEPGPVGIAITRSTPGQTPRPPWTSRSSAPPRTSPWQNAYVERFIGSIRQECLDHIIVCTARGLRGVLGEYVHCYQRSRTHLALDKDAPVPRAVAPAAHGDIVAIPLVGGLHHRYDRNAA
jgi:hypothetical protein